MFLHRLALPLGALLLGNVFLSADAFWDHGHMLVATITKIRALEGKSKYTKKKHIEDIESIAKRLQYTAELPSEAEFVTWFEWCPTMPDNMKVDVPRYWNKKDASKGVALRAIADHVFTTLHYFNPKWDVVGHSDKTDPLADLPTYWGDKEMDGIVWALNRLDKSFMADLTAAQRKDRFTPSSFFRQICLWSHFIGDLPQPCHFAGTQSTCWGKTVDNVLASDNGCNKVLMAEGGGELFKGLHNQLKDPSSSRLHVNNLHSIWDSMGWYPGSVEGETPGTEADARKGFFEDYALKFNTTTSLLHEDARRIMKEFPFEELEKKYNLTESYVDMAKQTYEWYRTKAFNIAEMPAEVYTCATADDKPVPFQPDDAYIIRLHDQSKLSIALGAARMERRLGAFMDNVDVKGIVESFDQAVKTHIIDDSAAATGVSMAVLATVMVFTFLA